MPTPTQRHTPTNSEQTRTNLTTQHPPDQISHSPQPTPNTPTNPEQIRPNPTKPDQLWQTDLREHALTSAAHSAVAAQAIG